MTPAPLRAVSREDEAGREVASAGNGNGGRYDRLEKRIRDLELDVREIKTDMKHLATRAWVLGGVLGAAGVGATIALAWLRLFS